MDEMNDSESLVSLLELVGKLVKGGHITHTEACGYPVDCTCGLDQIMSELETLGVEA